jgi:hypothetical protein
MAFSDLLAVEVIQGVIDELADINQLPQPLVWVNRIPSVSALDGEILARYSGQIFAADIIMDDAKAVVRSLNPFRLTQAAIPNLKHGMLLNQEMLNILQRIEAQSAGKREYGVFEDYVARITLEMRDGVYARMESLLVAMATDTFSYSRMGVILNNGTWGMPSDLKVTSAVLWSDATNATPINDLLTVRRVGLEKYGIAYDRVTMSHETFFLMTKTAEFINSSRLYSQLVELSGGGLGSFPKNDTATLLALANRVLDGMVIEFYDHQVWVESVDGTKTPTRYLPTNKVLLTTVAADNNRSVWDWANGVVFETMPGMVPLMIGSFDGEKEGPVAYATAADPHGNPPGKILWGVGRGFPRKHRESVSACLTVL